MPKPENKELNDALRLLREYHDLSRNDLIEGLNISKSYLSEIESGSKQVSLEMVKRYAEFLKLKPSMILLLGESLAEGRSAQTVEKYVAKNTRKLMNWIVAGERTERGSNASI